MRDDKTPKAHMSLWGHVVRAEARSNHEERTARDETTGKEKGGCAGRGAGRVTAAAAPAEA